MAGITQLLSWPGSLTLFYLLSLYLTELNEFEYDVRACSNHISSIHNYGDSSLEVLIRFWKCCTVALWLNQQMCSKWRSASYRSPHVIICIQGSTFHSHTTVSNMQEFGTNPFLLYFGSFWVRTPQWNLILKWYFLDGWNIILRQDLTSVPIVSSKNGSVPFPFLLPAMLLYCIVRGVL